MATLFLKCCDLECRKTLVGLRQLRGGELSQIMEMGSSNYQQRAAGQQLARRRIVGSKNWALAPTKLRGSSWDTGAKQLSV